MSLIHCPSCGKEISSQASRCVFCGTTLTQEGKRTCPECGAVVGDVLRVCPRCGYPMHDPETTRHELPPVEEKRGSAIWFIGILLAIGGLIFLCVKYEGNPQDEQDYLQAANDVFTAMNGSSREINDCSRLLMNVWEHAIREVKDPQTDPYVCPKGKFIWFNDALKKLYEDPTFLNKLEVINEHQQEIRRLRKQLQTPPRSQQEANNLLLKMMDTYIEISMLLLGPQGSYDDVSKKLNDMMAQYREFGMELQACDGKGYQIHDIIGKR